MSTSRTVLCAVYAAIAVAALIGGGAAAERIWRFHEAWEIFAKLVAAIRD